MVAHGFVILALTVFAFIPQAHAYLDAGTGSAILQAVLGVAFAGFVTLRMYWQRIKALVSKKAPASADADD
jgi:hypothetical protein